MAGNAYPNQPKKKYTPNLRGYIGQCETNYWQLNRLLPYLHEQDERVFGIELLNKAPVDCELDQFKSHVQQIRCQVLERCKYTTTLSLVQDANIADWFPKPAIIVRMYHDARMAEVLSFERNRYIQAIYTYPNKQMYQPDEKAQNNAFLGEWLSHCLAFGVSMSAIPLESD